MNIRRTRNVALAGLLALAAPLVFAGQLGPSPEDQSFINLAWQINSTEIRLGEIAQTSASNDDVKAFAKHMVEDHTKLRTEVEDLAKQDQGTVPQTLDQKHSDLVDKLSKVTGSDFDKQYMAEMIKGHQKAIAAFKTETTNTAQTPVEKWAEQTLPGLKMHLDMAKKTGAEVGAPIPDDNAAANANDDPQSNT